MRTNESEPYGKLVEEILAMASTFGDLFDDKADLIRFLQWVVEHHDKPSLASQIASCGFALALSVLAIGGALGLVARWVSGT